jgi:membrane-associated progesterone receptor component
MYELTLELLRMFDGSRDSQIFIAIKGVVYDVTSAKVVYQPGGEYHVFAGKEISRGLAKSALTDDEIQPYGDLEGLTKEELEALDGWISYYAGKYKVVGKIVPKL